MKVSSAAFFRTFVWFLPFLLLISFAAQHLLSYELQRQQAVIKFQAQEHLASAQYHLQANLEQLVRDIRYLSQAHSLQTAIRRQDSESKHRLEQNWVQFARSVRRYAQIRWLDEQGHEQVRVDYHQATGTTQVVPQHALQDKSQRYYFSAIQGMSSEEVYLSPLDLNQEHEQVLSEPMLRLVIPLRVEEQARGAIVLNFRADQLLARVKNLGGSQLRLVNQQGYWLIGPQPEDEWGFMYGRSQLTLGHRYPDIWQWLHQPGATMLTDPHSGLWFAHKLMMPTVVAADCQSLWLCPSSTHYQWFLLHHTPPEGYPSYGDILQHLEGRAVLVGLLLALLMAVLLSHAVARQRLQRRQLSQQNQQLRVEIQARHQAEQLAHKQAQRYQGILRACGDGFVLLDTQGQILDCNASYAQLLQRPEAHCQTELIQQQLDLPADLLLWLQDLESPDTLRRFETHLPSQKKGIRHAEVVLARIDDTAQYCGFVREMTEHKLRENHLRLAAQVFEHAYEGILITDARGRILNVNGEFCHLSGYSKDEVLGKTPRILHSEKQNNAFYRQLFEELRKKGHWYGELWNRHKEGHLFAVAQSISMVKGVDDEVLYFVSMFSDVTAQKKYQEQLQYVALHDTLTGLPNRTLFSDRLQQAMGQARWEALYGAVIYLDLDGFKVINDTYGHNAGDALLVGVANNLQKVLRHTDTLARLGGDEFAVVLSDLKCVKEVEQCLHKLLAAANQPIPYHQHLLQVSASLGATFFPQAEGEIPGEGVLIRQADQAMYQAKRQGKNGYYLFNSQADKPHPKAKPKDLHDIKRGLQQREFVLFYQPKVNMRGGEAGQVEALIRWQHPELGLLGPGEFLPTVEAHPLGIELGQWVMETALQQMACWLEQGLEVKVSVNLSGEQLLDPEFTMQLTALLGRYPQVPSTNLELEVLESSALSDLQQVRGIMRQCRELGVTFAIDDFGTGYSSLSYLKKLPAQRIKIDQSFVQDMLNDPDDLSILNGIIGLSQAFHMDLIAEGVETLEQGVMLLCLGCHRAQGYGIARPMPAEAVPDWLNQWSPPDIWLNQPKPSPHRTRILSVMVAIRAWVLATLNGPDSSLTEEDMERHDQHLQAWMQTAAKTPAISSHPVWPELQRCYAVLRQQAQAVQTCHCSDFLHSCSKQTQPLMQHRDQLLQLMAQLI